LNCRGVLRRARIVVALFSLASIACVAAPVLAASSDDSGKIGISDAQVVVPAQRSGAEVSGGGEAESGGEGEAEPAPESPTSEEPVEESPPGFFRDPGLDTPEATAEREESQLAYTDLTVGEEQVLLQSFFASQLAAIAADPSRRLAGVGIEEMRSPTEALANVEGEPTLIDSSVPLRAPDAEGKKSKVDLGLRETEQGYAPTNPLVDVQIPRGAGGQIEIGKNGLALSLQGAVPKQATLTVEGGVLAPEAAEDTSLLLTPISAGLELSAMLDSRRSPEQIAFSVALPKGDELRAGADGGADVLDPKGEVAYRITAPRAVDAQGTALPVKLAVEGGMIVLTLAHREMDVAYPILIDPEIVENWSGFTDTSKLNYWNWQYSGVGAEDYIGWRSCIVSCWGNGLYVRSRSNFTYPAASYGRWWLGAPNSTAYFRYVNLGPIHYDVHGCTANQPHGYIGVWNDGGYWAAITNAYPSGYVEGFANGGEGFATGSRTIFVAIGAASNTNIKCGHDYALNGATLYLADPENPTVSALSGIPSGWIAQGTPFTVTVPVSDPGLGVKSAKLSSDLGESPQELGCSGSFGSSCPASHNFGFSVNAGSFPEGERSISASATDALGKFSNTQSAAVKIDRTKPGLILKGQLAEATDEEGGLKAEEEDETAFDALHLPVYDLTLEATDGSSESAATERSGVKSVELFLDGAETPLKTWTQPGEPSACDSCALTVTYPLKLNELSADTHHTLRVLATDFAGNEPREREIGFEYVPATGEKDEYVMQHFPLFDTEAEPEEGVEASGPELAVNLMNGNLVFHQTDVEVPGPAADLEVERFYNSLLPEDQNSEFGDGWTLAQTPELEVEEPPSGSPEEGTLIEESGAVESQVKLPTEAGEERFDPTLQATIAREPDGGYTISDETGESTGPLQLDESGQATELETGEYSGVEYQREEGELSEISVRDDASLGGDPEQVARQEAAAEAPVFAESFGTQGSGPAQFERAEALARDPEGNLWVGDLHTVEGFSRIEKLDPEGNFIREIKEPGGGAEGRLYISGLASDAEGNLWMTDWSHARVEEFDSEGNFIQRFGSQGTGNGQFDLPEGVAIDPAGHVWVADKRNGRIQEFDSEGNFIKVVGSHGTEPGQLQRPNSITVGPAGNVWVTDISADQVDVFDPEGNFVRRFGSEGSEPGQFRQPGGIAVDDAGHVWVGDQLNDRVQEFAEDGTALASFGSEGSGEGQFKLCYTIGLAVDAAGNDVWITDYNNHRLQHWARPGKEVISQVQSFGTQGSGPAQFERAEALARDPEGNLWVGDLHTVEGFSRIEKLDPEGNFIREIKEPGGGAEGRLYISGLASDAEGNLWMTDWSHARVEEFDSEGNFIQRFGSQGTGNGQFDLPEGVAIDPAGHVWVADKRNGRIQEFDSEGNFIKVVGSHGTEPGQLQRPNSITVGPAGNVWVTDISADQVDVFDPEGNFVRRFGSEGSEPGQFRQPGGIAVDDAGHVWVGDQLNDRVQEFAEDGTALASFGSEGSGEGQFKLCYTIGLAVDAAGNDVWITDYNNHRLAHLHQFRVLSEEAPLAVQEEDPSVEVEVEGGLVEKLEGEGAGTVEYDHSGEMLTAATSEEGETTYEYDEAGHMTKVTLPNGSWAEVGYEAAYGRVSWIKVSIEGGESSTTHLEYTDSPSRSTRVVPDGAPATVYDMAADGSFVRWQNATKAPEIEDLAGVLVDPEHRETPNPIEAGAYLLEVKGYSAEGIAQIEVVANGELQVDEKTCEEDFEKEGVECEHVSDQWVLETANWPAGILYLEAIVTDREGHEASERFWVNIPQTPPPEPEAEEPPTYKEVKEFREETGLDLDIKGNEEAINERIFTLLRDWNSPGTPAGEVARASALRWGIPLRAVDVAELEYREEYINYDIPLVEEWGEAHATTFAGYLVDEPAGGTIRIAFTANPAGHMAELTQQAPLIAEGRLAPETAPTGHSLASLQQLVGEIGSEIESNASLSALVVSTAIDVSRNLVRVGGSDTSQLTATLQSIFGANSPIVVEYAPGGTTLSSKRMMAGENLRTRYYDQELQTTIFTQCTAGYGAFRKVRRAGGRWVRVDFLLTAGHCSEVGKPVQKFRYPHGTDNYFGIGHVAKSSWEGWHKWETDALAVKLEGVAAPRRIFWQGSPSASRRVTRIGRSHPGDELCFSGVVSNFPKCGHAHEIEERRAIWAHGVQHGRQWKIPISVGCEGGDSGSPVWDRTTGRVVGLLVEKESWRHCPDVWNTTTACYATPLLHPKRVPTSQAPGVFGASAFKGLRLSRAQ